MINTTVSENLNKCMVIVENLLLSLKEITTMKVFLSKISVENNITDEKELEQYDALTRFYITNSKDFILRKGKNGGIVPAFLLKDKKQKVSKSQELIDAKNEALEKVNEKLKMAAKIAPPTTMEELDFTFEEEPEKEDLFADE